MVRSGPFVTGLECCISRSRLTVERADLHLIGEPAYRRTCQNQRLFTLPDGESTRVTRRATHARCIRRGQAGGVEIAGVAHHNRKGASPLRAVSRHDLALDTGRDVNPDRPDLDAGPRQALPCHLHPAGMSAPSLGSNPPVCSSSSTCGQSLTATSWSLILGPRPGSWLRSACPVSPMTCRFARYVTRSRFPPARRRIAILEIDGTPGAWC